MIDKTEMFDAMEVALELHMSYIKGLEARIKTLETEVESLEDDLEDMEKEKEILEDKLYDIQDIVGEKANAFRL